MKQVVWNIDKLDSIGGHETTVLGSPKVIETASGKAVEFDGKGDGLFVDTHPLAGAEAFTVEVIFKPYPDGLKEQRFFHMQENGSEDRVMFETRLTDDNRWFLDTFIKSGPGEYTMFAEDFKHPLGPWYHAAIVMDGKTFRHYVNCNLELSEEVEFTPQLAGKTSLGVRLNKVFWYKGAIRKTRFTPKALSPAEFLRL